MIVFVRMFPDHVLQQVLAIALEVVVLIVAVVDLPETVHVHLAHKGDGLLGVELILAGLQIGFLELVAI